MEFKKQMKNVTVFIKPIEKKIAKQMCVANHYSHSWHTCFGIYNFGIYDEREPEKLLGCAVFGRPMNVKSYKSLNPTLKEEEFVELNRLWVDDCLGKNTETVFLSLCFKYFKKYTPVKVIQSFADGRLGCGTIYKASNFKYYGYDTTLFFNDIVHGTDIHKLKFENTESLSSMIGVNLGLARGYFRAFRVKTYRYIYFIDRRYEKTMTIKEQPYPSYDKGKMFNDEYVQSIHIMARSYLGCIKMNLPYADEFMRYMKEHFTDEQIKQALERAEQNATLIKHMSGQGRNIDRMKTRIINFSEYYEPLH